MATCARQLYGMPKHQPLGKKWYLENWRRSCQCFEIHPQFDTQTNHLHTCCTTVVPNISTLRIKSSPKPSMGSPSSCSVIHRGTFVWTIFSRMLVLQKVMDKKNDSLQGPKVVYKTKYKIAMHVTPSCSAVNRIPLGVLCCPYRYLQTRKMKVTLKLPLLTVS